MGVVQPLKQSGQLIFLRTAVYLFDQTKATYEVNIYPYLYYVHVIYIYLSSIASKR